MTQRRSGFVGQRIRAVNVSHYERIHAAQKSGAQITFSRFAHINPRAIFSRRAAVARKAHTTATTTKPLA